VTSGTNGNGGGDGAGGVMAANHVLGNATAYIQHATVTTTSGNVSVDAENNASIDATENTALNSGGKTGTLVTAFNMIGWSGANFGTMAVDTILGDSALLGTEAPDTTTAYISASTVTASGSVNVT